MMKSVKMKNLEKTLKMGREHGESADDPIVSMGTRRLTGGSLKVEETSSGWMWKRKFNGGET